MPANEAEIQARSAEPEIILQHYRAIEEERDNVDDAKAAEASKVAAAAASGVDIKALKHARKVVRMGPRTGKSYLDNLVFYVNLVSGGMMGQEELFGTNQDSSVDETMLEVQRTWIQDRDAERIGYAAGKNGEPPDNNEHQGGTSAHDRWARGWADGHEEYVAARGTEIHPKKGSKHPEDRAEDPEDGE